MNYANQQQLIFITPPLGYFKTDAKVLTNTSPYFRALTSTSSGKLGRTTVSFSAIEVIDQSLSI